MADDTNILPKDQNFVRAAGFESSTQPGVILAGKIIEATGRIKVDLSGGGGGTVTDISVATANGFAGTSDGDPVTPTLTLETTVTGFLQGDGTAISAASTTGSGSTLVLSTSPVLVTPTLGVATATSINGLTITASTGTLTITNAKVVSVSNTLTFTGTDGSSVAFGAGGTVLYTASVIPLTIGTTTIASGTNTRILYNNSGVLGEYTLTGTGTVVAMQTNPTLSGATFTDATNIVFNTTTGTKIGTATSQKLAFYNSTPIIQPTGDVVTALQNLGLVASATIAGATTIVVADEASDTTCFPVFVTAATGTLGPKSNAGLTFNSSTALLTATLLAGTTSVTSATIRASSNDSGSLGASGTAFSDLFLASGAVIDFAAGNSVITHSSAVLTVSTGDLRVTSAGTNSASVVTVGGTQTLTSKTLTSPTITTASLSGTQLLAEGASIGLDPAGSADGAYSGLTITATAGYTQAFGDLVYLASADSRWELADADAAATAGPVALAMVVVAGTDGNPCTLLLQGTIRADAKFPTMTIGATQYVGETAGAIQGAIPTGADNIIRTVGYALTADELYFNPSTDWQVTVA